MQEFDAMEVNLLFPTLFSLIIAAAAADWALNHQVTIIPMQ